MRKSTEAQVYATAVIMARTELKCSTQEAENRIRNKPQILSLAGTHRMVRGMALEGVDSGKLKLEGDEKFAGMIERFREEIRQEEQYLTQARTKADTGPNENETMADLLNFAKEVFGVDVSAAVVVDMSPEGLDKRITSLMACQKRLHDAQAAYDEERAIVDATAKRFGNQIAEKTWQITGREYRITMSETKSGTEFRVEQDTSGR